MNHRPQPQHRTPHWPRADADTLEPVFGLFRPHEPRPFGQPRVRERGEIWASPRTRAHAPTATRPPRHTTRCQPRGTLHAGSLGSRHGQACCCTGWASSWLPSVRSVRFGLLCCSQLVCTVHQVGGEAGSLHGDSTPLRFASTSIVVPRDAAARQIARARSCGLKSRSSELDG